MTATATQDVRHVPEAGIQLVNVTVEDSGVYTVNVVVNLHGAIVVQSQHARLVVAGQELCCVDTPVWWGQDRSLCCFDTPVW